MTENFALKLNLGCLQVAGFKRDHPHQLHYIWCIIKSGDCIAFVWFPDLVDVLRNVYYENTATSLGMIARSLCSWLDDCLPVILFFRKSRYSNSLLEIRTEFNQSGTIILEVFWQDQVEKLTFFPLIVSSIDNRLSQSCVDVVIADIDPLLERETWSPDVLVFPEDFIFPPGVFLSSGSKMWLSM